MVRGCTLATDSDLAALGQAVAAVAAGSAAPAETRAQLDALTGGALPGCWPELVAMGLPGLSLPAGPGGGGGSLLAACVAIEAAAAALVPGPLLATAMAGRALLAGGADDAALAPLCSGLPAAVAFAAAGVAARETADGLHVAGEAAPVLGAAAAQRLVLGATLQTRLGAEEVWFWVDRDQVSVTALEGPDLTRDAGSVSIDTVVASDHLLKLDSDGVRRAVAALAAAEAVGLARWCIDTCVDHAKVRVQFGKPIGSFQALQQRLARAFVTAEVAAAAAWDAAAAEAEPEDQQELAALDALVLCLPAAVEVALESVCALGGIGFTWEHDLHLYARRAEALLAAFGPVDVLATRLGELGQQRQRRRPAPATEVPAGVRDEIEADLDAIAAAPAAGHPALLAAGGYAYPHYPKPYGRSAAPAEQLFIQAAIAERGLPVPETSVAEWVLPTLLAHGTEAQRERYVPATLTGDLVWCQLFSEPGAGSDLASLTTRATRTATGWHLSGQKVWTSSAHLADYGVCLARSEPDAPRHRGISYFIVDMRAPGVEIRPLRQASGEAHFNEVFLDVELPEDALVGERAGGWALARTTLGNERVSIAGGVGRTRLDLLLTLARDGELGSTGHRAELGRLVAQQDALSALAHRDVTRRLAGLQPGPGASVAKLAGGLHNREVLSAGLGWLGKSVIGATGNRARLLKYYRDLPALLIGGGTEEIQLGVIARHVLGLPRP